MATLTTPGKFNGWLKGKNIAWKKLDFFNFRNLLLCKENPQNFEFYNY